MKKDEGTHLGQDLIASGKDIMIDKLDGLLIRVLQEAASKVHLCGHQLEGRHNTSARRNPLNN